MNLDPWPPLKEFIALLKVPAPDAPQRLERLRLMERDLMLPLKAVGILMLFHSFYFSFSPWIGIVADALALAVESTQYFFWLYVSANILMAAVLLAMDRLPLALVQWAVYTISLVDGLFLAALTLVTGGYDSILFWLFVGLIIRNAVSFPPTMLQLTLNFSMILCYILGGVTDLFVANNLDETIRRALGLASAASENPAEPILLRVVLLLLMTLCCYAVQVLLERQRQVEEEAREFGMREGQLQTAGRLAAEFAHQIKNPLAIINNAAYSLQRALKDRKLDVAEHLRIIQEEVERSDRIITQIMGYAQLTEGRVEKLNAIEELDEAIGRAFPPAAGFPVQIHRDYGPNFPPLLMQRRHLSEAFINVLQNAREAANGKPVTLWVTAHCQSDYAIEVTFRDNGPGIPPDKLEKIFEAYYTTKEKGTGLGLATVKHNLELYGGSVRVESELGKGARFILVFPARTFIQLARKF